MRKLRPCLNCGKLMRNEKFCSKECSHDYRLNVDAQKKQKREEEKQKLLSEGKIGHPCPYCGKMTLNKHYCSNECRYNDINNDHPCLNCGKITKRPKFCCSKCCGEYTTKQWIEKWLSGENSGYAENDHRGNVPHVIRNYLLKKCDYKCTRCGRDDAFNPYSKTWTLDVDHIDGNYKNNRPENLTVLCPSCHSLTKFYKGTAVGTGKGRPKTWKMIKEDDEES